MPTPRRIVSLSPNVSMMLFALGADAVVVGIQPEVAFAMVQLGLTLEGTTTALDLEEGLEILKVPKVDTHGR